MSQLITSETISKIQRKIFNSRFFTISLLLHVILVIVLGGTVLFHKMQDTPDFTGDPGSGFVSSDTTPQPPQPQTQPVEQQQPSFTVSTQTPSQTMDAITANSPVPSTFSLPTVMAPIVTPQVSTITQTAAPQAPTMPGGMTKEIAKGIAGFSGGWVKKGSGGPGSSLRSREYEFTAYLAKYSGGNWDSTVDLKDGKIVKGSLPNLLFVMGKLSRDKIKSEPQAVPLDLASDEIFAKKPPFIFFTGHKDFVLSEKEVENLQKYLRLGGCLWGDSSVPGRRSRFDIAFRREMRRIVPDVDKDFEPLPPNHDIYNKTYYKEIRDVPPGINFYREPVYALKVYGEIAILYTANDYGDMWRFGLTEKGEFDKRRDEDGNWIAMDYGMMRYASSYFGNISEPSVFATYKFGTNIIIHLVTRWEDKVRSVSSSL